MTTPSPQARRPPLTGVRVLDLATLFAGPLVATFLGDFGADVIKVEHPRGDPVRGHGHAKHGIGLWAKMINRNKRMLSLDLSKPAAQEILSELAAHSDVLIENFRPGTLERWHIGPDQLQAQSPKLVVVRMTAFGQFGPYSNRPASAPLPKVCLVSRRSRVRRMDPPRSRRLDSPMGLPGWPAPSRH